MPPYRPPQKRSQDDEASTSSSRPVKRGKPKPKKQEPTYDTYDEAMEGGVDFEEKGERYASGERAQRNYERALELYEKAWGLERRWDAGYNQGRVLYTLGTAFLLPPSSIDYLRKSLALYEATTTLEATSPILHLDGLFNFAQTATSLADMLEESSREDTSAEVRDLREKAASALEKVLFGQAEYLDSHPSAAHSKESTPAVDIGNGGVANMEVDSDMPPTGEQGAEESEAYETYLPTASAFTDTALALVDVHLDLLESRTPPVEPSPEQQTAISSILGMIAKAVPPERQAEVDLAEIKILLCLDRIIWSLYRSTATLESGWDRSLLGAIGALEALVRAISKPTSGGEVDVTVKAEVLVTLADTHSALARRSLLLATQLPPGPTHLAQNAWLHFTSSIECLTTALDLPKSLNTSREFHPSVLLDLASASLARARLWTVNETAGRNVGQLLENALAYNQKAIDSLGVGFVHLGNNTILSDGSHPRGWDAEVLAREAVLQRIRIYSYGVNTDMVPAVKTRYAKEAEALVQKARQVKEAPRRVSRRDLERYLEDLVEEEGGVGEDEKGWWETIGGSLGV